MSAKEMFEELGYKQKIKDNVIYYYKESNASKEYECIIHIYHINFILKNKELFINKNLNCKEIQAINKQVEELGWNNDSERNV